MSALTCFLLALGASALIWKGSEWLEKSTEALANHYGLPDIVRGAVLVAVGSSFPELSTTVISTLLHGEFELGVAAIVGSALFNILVIPALSGLVNRTQLLANRDLVYKEALFYVIAVAVLLLTFSFAVIFNPAGEGGPSIIGEMNRWLALLPLGIYALYLFVQYQDSIDFEADNEAADLPVAKAWFWLVVSLVVIVFGVEVLVRAAIRLGEIYDTPSFFWGMTVVAAGTSIPDCFVSVRAARKGQAVTSLANVLGSNTFDLLVAIPAGVLIAGAALINYSVAAPLMGILTLATLVLFTFLRTNMRLSQREGAILLGLYLVFVLWIGLETFEVIDLLSVVPPPTPS